MLKNLLLESFHENLWFYIGLGMLGAVVAFFHYLATRDDKVRQKKSPLILPPEYGRKSVHHK